MARTSVGWSTSGAMRRLSALRMLSMIRSGCQPMSVSSWRHRGTRSSTASNRFADRLVRAAIPRARYESKPASSRASSISSDRFEWRSITSWGTPAMAQWRSFPDGPSSDTIP